MTPTPSGTAPQPGPPVEVVDAPAEHRYEARVGGVLAGWAEYQDAAGRGGADHGMRVMTHTEVVPSHEGRGVGSALARTALDDVRARGTRVLALCPFILGWMVRHPEYQDLEYRSRTSPQLQD